MKPAGQFTSFTSPWSWDTKKLLVEQFVKPTVLSAPGKTKVMKREVMFASQLSAIYPDTRFWFQHLKMSFWLDSLSYFKGPTGKVELERSWRMFQYELEQKALDRDRKAAMIGGSQSGAGGDEASMMKPAKKRRTNVTWADSAGEDAAYYG